MGKHLKLDNDVLKELINKALDNKPEKMLMNLAIDSGQFSKSDIDVNEVLRAFLGMKDINVEVKNNYPSSIVPEIQNLLDGLKDTIFSISKAGMQLHSNRKWVANPNTVTITVQDARARNLRITVYGRPNEFDDIKQLLEIQDDMASFSRFLLNDASQLPSAIKVIQYSYNLKKERGRL